MGLPIDAISQRQIVQNYLQMGLPIDAISHGHADKAQLQITVLNVTAADEIVSAEMKLRNC